ncbi:MAG: hypothetical protein JO279_17365 [Verrucomicrobia bacterium]|nr:hypothetical protein [Verrucomicrobiota bacterium]
MDKHGRRNSYSDTVAFFWKIEVEAARYAAELGADGAGVQCAPREVRTIERIVRGGSAMA